MPVNHLRDLNNIFIGHATNKEAGTGCTVIVCPEGATGGVDVRGGAPATRETDLLRPEETVQILNAVILSGGSAYGLAASVGVAEELERRGMGLDVGVGVVPIVSGACLFDLTCGKADVRPTAEDGVNAVRAAFNEREQPLERGCVGVGTGCTVGKLAGMERAMKSGIGEAVENTGKLTVGALSAVNAAGNVVDPHTLQPIAGLLSPDKTQIQDEEQALIDQGDNLVMPLERTNTTISCVVTNAKLTKPQATKVAQMAADGYAHAICPTHTSNDGDTIFVMSTGDVQAPIDLVGTMAMRAIQGAIVDAVKQATSSYGLIAAQDL
ncbi:P1 family peptidase [Atopobium sp. oral taxon 416]|uniref:P1 family peptidase n=1 Tax=Atopobium sp. oral taxon 416 TaxID=712157 RepID=UPI001BACB82C|nr:P1 family peptidase [Atopobium sp. oral taxon 416]QUC02342.1 P1 family peptidase [Atopobium sp. oral taxon 416]